MLKINLECATLLSFKLSYNVNILSHAEFKRVNSQNLMSFGDTNWQLYESNLHFKRVKKYEKALYNVRSFSFRVKSRKSERLDYSKSL